MKLLITGLLCILHTAAFAQTEIKGKKPMLQPFPSAKPMEVIEYPPLNVRVLSRRNHMAYNKATHSYDKDYVMRKYQVVFPVPPDLSRSIKVKIPGREVNAQWINATSKTLWFSPKIIVRNLTSGRTREFPLSETVLKAQTVIHLGLLLEEPGQYQFHFQQTFPIEARFRQDIQGLFLYAGEDGRALNEQERKRPTDSVVALFQDVLGKRTTQQIGTFTVNYDFLVAAIGDSFMAGEGNPMSCGEDLAEGGNSWYDAITDVYEDVKDNISDVVDAAVSLDEDELTSALRETGALLTLSVVEQIAGACTITTLNVAGLTQPNFDVEAGWIENGAEGELRVSRSYINPTAPAAFEVETKYRGIAVTYLNYASSGATTADLYLKNQHAFQRVSQIDELARNLQGTHREIDALMIGIGANDVAFSNIMSALLQSSARDLLKEFGGGPVAQLVYTATSGVSQSSIRSKIREAVDQLDAKFAALDQKIKRSLKVKKVFLLEYPNAQFSKIEGRDTIISDGCGVLNLNPLNSGPLRFTKEHAKIVTEAGELLNRKLQALAQKHGWIFVSGSTALFKGRGYCANSNDSYYRAAETSCACQGNYQGMLHPNQKGFAAIKPLVLKSMESTFAFDQLRIKNSVKPGTQTVSR